MKTKSTKAQTKDKPQLSRQGLRVTLVMLLTLASFFFGINLLSSRYDWKEAVSKSAESSEVIPANTKIRLSEREKDSRVVLAKIEPYKSTKLYADCTYLYKGQEVTKPDPTDPQSADESSGYTTGSRIGDIAKDLGLGFAPPSSARKDISAKGDLWYWELTLNNTNADQKEISCDKDFILAPHPSPGWKTYILIVPLAVLSFFFWLILIIGIPEYRLNNKEKSKKVAK